MSRGTTPICDWGRDSWVGTGEEHLLGPIRVGGG